MMRLFLPPPPSSQRMDVPVSFLRFPQKSLPYGNSHRSSVVLGLFFDSFLLPQIGAPQDSDSSPQELGESVPFYKVCEVPDFPFSPREHRAA